MIQVTAAPVVMMCSVILLMKCDLQVNEKSMNILHVYK